MPSVRCRKVPAVPAAEPAVLQAAGDLLPLTIGLRTDVTGPLAVLRATARCGQDPATRRAAATIGLLGSAQAISK